MIWEISAMLEMYPLLNTLAAEPRLIQASLVLEIRAAEQQKILIDICDASCAILAITVVNYATPDVSPFDAAGAIKVHDTKNGDVYVGAWQGCCIGLRAEAAHSA